MRRFLFALCLSAISTNLFSQIAINSLVTPLNENFDSLATTGTSNVLPAGWALSEVGSSASADGFYATGTGSSTGGNVYSFGAAASTERALGMIQTGTLVPTIGASFVNQTGTTVTSIVVSYTGEEWRAGGTTRRDRIDFQYSLDATTILNGTWTDVSALDFITPNISSVGAKDGNVAANRLQRIGLLTGFSLPPSGVIFIRWTDADADGSDDGLAIDEFSLAAFDVTPAVINIENLSFVEGESASSDALVKVKLQSSVTALLSFNASSAVGTATSPADFTTMTNQAFSIPSGSTFVDVPIEVFGDTNIEPNETFTMNISNVSTSVPLFIANTLATVTIVNDDPLQKIHAIQGAGNSAPLTTGVNIIGPLVGFEGIVTAVATRGFFVQEQIADYDLDAATSEGIYVFMDAPVAAEIMRGSLVRVVGNVVEFSGAPTAEKITTTEIFFPTVTVVANNQTLPASIIMPTPSASNNIDANERYEGMHVSLNGTYRLTGPTDGSVDDVSAVGRTFGTLYVTQENNPRPFRDVGTDIKEILADPSCIRPCYDSNEEIIAVDTDDLLFPSVELDVGMSLNNIAGPLHYAFGTYVIEQDPFVPLSIGGSTLLATPAPLANPEHVLTIGAYNLQRLLNDVDDPFVPIDEEPVATAAGFERRIGKLSAAIRHQLRLPDILAVIEVENQATLQALADRINTDEGANSPQYSVCLIDGPTPGGGNGFAGFGRLDVGFIVKQKPVSVGGPPRIELPLGGCSQALTSESHIDPRDGSIDLTYDRPPLQVRVIAHDSNGASFPITVIANHFLSLLSVSNTEVVGASSTGERGRTKRKDQAEALAAYVHSRQANNPNENIVVLGDFNAFEFNDGYGDVVGGVMGTPAPAIEQLTPIGDFLSNGDLINLSGTEVPTQRYSYVESGTAQTLDHILINQNMQNNSTSAILHHARINADFSNAFRDIPNDGRKSSDHDPVIAYFDIPIFNNTPNAVGSLPNISAMETQNVLLNASLSFIDGDNDVLSYVATNLPPGLLINLNTGLISGSVNLGAAINSPYLVTVSATDPSLASANQTFTFSVLPFAETIFANGFE